MDYQEQQKKKKNMFDGLFEPEIVTGSNNDVDTTDTAKPSTTTTETTDSNMFGDLFSNRPTETTTEPEEQPQPEVKEPSFFEKIQQKASEVVNTVSSKAKSAFTKEDLLDPNNVTKLLNPTTIFNLQTVLDAPLQQRLNDIQSSIDRGEDTTNFSLYGYGDLNKEKERIQRALNADPTDLAARADKVVLAREIFTARTTKNLALGFGSSVASFLDAVEWGLPKVRQITPGLEDVPGLGVVQEKMDEAVVYTANNLSDKIKEWVQTAQPEDPTFVDKLTQGAGSAAAFYLPGAGVAKATSLIAQTSPRVALFFGNSVMTFFEASAEAGSTYDELLKQGKSKEEADEGASRVFWGNSILIGLTNRLGLLGDDVVGVKKMLKSASFEGIQEYAQQAIQNVNVGAEWDAGTIESGVIGAIIGGGMSTIEVVPPDQKTEVQVGEEQIQKILQEENSPKTAEESQKPFTQQGNLPVEPVKKNTFFVKQFDDAGNPIGAFTRVEGEQADLGVEGMEAFVYQDGNTWKVAEARTGGFIASATSKEQAIVDASTKINSLVEQGTDIKGTIANAVSASGLSPRFDPARAEQAGEMGPAEGFSTEEVAKFVEDANAAPDTGTAREILKPVFTRIEEISNNKGLDAETKTNELLAIRNTLQNVRGGEFLSEVNFPIDAAGSIYDVLEESVPPTTPNAVGTTNQNGTENTVNTTNQSRRIAATEPVQTQGETKKSRFFERAKEFVKNLEGEVTYNQANREESLTRASDFVQQFPDRASRVARGLENAPEGVLPNDVSILLMEQARNDGDFELYGQLAEKLTKRATRAGQDINALRGVFNENSTYKFVQQVLAERTEDLGKSRFVYEKNNKKQNPTEAVDNYVKTKAENLKEKEVKTKVKKTLSLEETINNLTCKI